MTRTHYPFVFLMLLISAIFFSCKKDKETPAEHPLFSKWHIASHIDSTYYFMANETRYLNYQGTDDDYIDIRKDGTLIRFENGKKETTTYTIAKDTSFLRLTSGPIGGWPTTYYITVLTNDSLQLDGSADYMLSSHDRGLTHYSFNKR